MYKKLLLNIADGVATIVLNKPETLNSLDLVMREELAEALARVAEDKAIQAVVLTGAGKGFCSGGDISSMRTDLSAGEGRERLRRLNRIPSAVWNMEKPVIAAVNGVCAGGGMGLALACDFIFAADSARFVQSFIKIGLVPDMGNSYTLARRIGPAKAKDMMITARTVTAGEALAIGLVDRVHPDETLLGETLAVARSLASSPQPSLGLIKTLVNHSLTTDFATALENEAYAQGLCYASPHFAEGRKAFLEKRKPVFK